MTGMLASVNTMSSQTRKYELKVRADNQRETRDRIARTAAELHEEVGVARTTVAEIARRAGVSRLTVYNHFPDLESLLPACAAHYETLHPRPDLVEELALADDEERVTAVLHRLYGWHRETQPLFGKVYSDRQAVPGGRPVPRGERRHPAGRAGRAPRGVARGVWRRVSRATRAAAARRRLLDLGPPRRRGARRPRRPRRS